MRVRAVLDRLALLQFALLFVPGLIVTLAVYGSEFEVPSGKLIAALFLWLPVQAIVTRPLARRVAASPFAWTILCVATAILVTWAYRPLHFGWWDERSVPQALSMVAIGASSLFLSSCAAERVRGEGKPFEFGLAAAIGITALPWLVAELYPYFMFFGVALVAAASLTSVASEAVATFVNESTVTGASKGVLLWSVGVASIDLSLPVWERNIEGGFGGAVALALVAAGVSAMLPRGRDVFLAIGAISFLAACAFPVWVLNPLHQVFAGLALGAAVSGLELSDRRSPLGGAALCIGVGWIVANGLTQNLVYAAGRAVFVLPPLILSFRSWKRSRT